MEVGAKFWMFLNAPECSGTPASVYSLVPAQWLSVLRNSCLFLTFLPFRSFMFGLPGFTGRYSFFFCPGRIADQYARNTAMGLVIFFSEVSLLLLLPSLHSLCSEADRKNQWWKPKYWKNTCNTVEESQGLIPDMKNLEALFQLLALESWW